MFGCGHNPEINTDNKNYITVSDLEEIENPSHENKIYNMMMHEEPVLCYYWIPLDFTEQDKKE